jgi:hypothetical protein
MFENFIWSQPFVIKFLAWGVGSKILIFKPDLVPFFEVGEVMAIFVTEEFLAFL